ncbi:unnamed protein product [Cladocopium goreaui]|uniref:FAD dependent oxidoreductase domain-containing protein n=1 Tax=Cladocopium goreaui TaxID=2562237 RepID=A0A9P1CXK9_9DINO|nr:unnamed protein product [Cladocopium goreaui]
MKASREAAAEGEGGDQAVDSSGDEGSEKPRKSKKKPTKEARKATTPSGSPWNYNSIRLSFIHAARKEKGLNFKAAKELWDHSQEKRDFLAPISLAELKRRKFVAKSCAHMLGAAIDVDINPRVFDLTTPGGFVSPADFERNSTMQTWLYGSTRTLLQIVFQNVWSGRFWMGRFKSLSPKPHVMYSNDKEMILLLCRKAGYMSREEAQQCPVRTSKTYLDSRGQKRSVGRKKELRESQFYTPEFGQFVLEMVQSRAGEPLPGPPNPPTLDATMTDLELFRHHCMDLGDQWPEAKLMDAVLYLARCKHMQIPHGWDRVLHDLGLRSMNV